MPKTKHDPYEPRARRKARKAAFRKRENWMPAFQAATLFNRDQRERLKARVRFQVQKRGSL